MPKTEEIVIVVKKRGDGTIIIRYVGKMDNNTYKYGEDKKVVDKNKWATDIDKLIAELEK